MRKYLFPLSTLVTPNVPEAAALLDEDVATSEHVLIEQAKSLLKLGPQAVLLKGGHLDGEEAIDLLVCRHHGLQRIRSARVSATSRGTGCALASAIAAGLASGVSLFEACQQAKRYVVEMLSRKLIWQSNTVLTRPVVTHSKGPGGTRPLVWSIPILQCQRQDDSSMQPLSSYTLADPKVMQNPYPYYERLRAEDPVHFDEGIRTWLVTRHEDIVAVARNTEVFSDEMRVSAAIRSPFQAEVNEYMQREGFMLLDPADSFKLDGELHTRRRKLVAHAFTGPAVAAMEARVAR
jgi:hypothetical protein